MDHFFLIIALAFRCIYVISFPEGVGDGGTSGIFWAMWELWDQYMMYCTCLCSEGNAGTLYLQFYRRHIGDWDENVFLSS